MILLRGVVKTELHITRKHPNHKFSFGDHDHPKSLVIVKLSHGMKYPSADKFLDKVAALLEKETHLIIDCTFVQSVDYTGVQAFRSLLLASVRKGLHIVFANLNDEVHREFEKLGLDHFHFVSSVDDAIGEYNKAIVISEIEEEESALDNSKIKVVIENVDGVNVSRQNTSTAELIEEPKIHSNQSTITKRLEQERLRRRLLRELKFQPHIYGDVPLIVGGNLDFGDELDKDPVDDDGENSNSFEEDDSFTSPSSSSDCRRDVADQVPVPNAGDTGSQVTSTQSEGRRRRHGHERNIQFLNSVLLRFVFLSQFIITTLILNNPP